MSACWITITTATLISRWTFSNEHFCKSSFGLFINQHFFLFFANQHLCILDIIKSASLQIGHYQISIFANWTLSNQPPCKSCQSRSSNKPLTWWGLAYLMTDLGAENQWITSLCQGFAVIWNNLFVHKDIFTNGEIELVFSLLWK